METHPVIPQNSDRAVIPATNDQGSSQQRKSYDCMFCKRGFTNAQALGGHMNMHRKDKAKLKQYSSYNRTTHPYSHSSGFPKNPPLFSPMSTKHRHEITTRKWARVFCPQDYCAIPSEETHDNKTARLDLDLELRLGPEPSAHPQPVIGTKKFF